MMFSLMKDEKKYNQITDLLFKLLEKRSLLGPSKYVAIKALNEQSCTINNDLAAQLESYRAMKIGKIAPGIQLISDVLINGAKSPNQLSILSDIKSRFTLLVFGASWCPACSSELSQNVSFYPKWKDHSVEVLFISLDEDTNNFHQCAGNFPFISTCDYKKWESPAVKKLSCFCKSNHVFVGFKSKTDAQTQCSKACRFMD